MNTENIKALLDRYHEYSRTILSHLAETDRKRMLEILLDFPRLRLRAFVIPKDDGLEAYLILGTAYFAITTNVYIKDQASKNYLLALTDDHYRMKRGYRKVNGDGHIYA